MKHSFLMAQSKHASPFIVASMHSIKWTRSHSPHFGPLKEQHFLFRDLSWLRGGLDTEQLTWLPGSEVFRQLWPPPLQYTCCHHLSMARRHSLSQQMRGLSKRAPQFLRDCGEEGGSRHARLWFLLTVCRCFTGWAGSVHISCHTLGPSDLRERERRQPVLYRVVVLSDVSSSVPPVRLWSCCFRFMWTDFFSQSF